MSNPVPDMQADQATQPAIEATAGAWPGDLVPGSPEWFAATPYDVLQEVTLADGTVLAAGSATTPAAMGLAHDIPAVHALVVDGRIWPTGVEH